MKQHPLSAAYPPMSVEEFATLRADIAVHGLRVAITLYEEQVLDGWHRYCACGESGQEPRFDTFNGSWSEAAAFTRSANIARRHLTQSELAIVAAEIAKLPTGRPGNSSPVTSLGVKGTADLFGVSTTNVQGAKAVLDSDDDALKADMRAGRVSIKKAARQVRARGKAKAAAERPTESRSAPASSDNITFLPNASVQITVKQWEKASAEQRALLLGYRNPKATLNEQKRGEDSNLIDWAKYSWNTADR